MYVLTELLFHKELNCLLNETPKFTGLLSEGDLIERLSKYSDETGSFHWYAGKQSVYVKQNDVIEQVKKLEDDFSIVIRYESKHPYTDRYRFYITKIKTLPNEKV